ncbi:MAG: 50S ribosomal protein L5 [Patescibacteria group bacterium]|nr:50S ribosomal protein L5 [Patescibacteria group bacterium]
MLRLQQKYKKEIIPAMMERFAYKSVMAVPKIDKVVVNCGFGSMTAGKGSGEREKIEEYLSKSLAAIVGQKPALRKARKSIAAFKLREGVAVGFKATLRGERMYGFLEELIGLVIPRIRDFRGIPLRSVSRTGVLAIGFKEFTVFSEIKMEKEKGIFGLEIAINTTAKTKEEAVELLRLMGMPLQKK